MNIDDYIKVLVLQAPLSATADHKRIYIDIFKGDFAILSQDYIEIDGAYQCIWKRHYIL